MTCELKYYFLLFSPSHHRYSACCVLQVAGCNVSILESNSRLDISILESNSRRVRALIAREKSSAHTDASMSKARSREEPTGIPTDDSAAPAAAPPPAQDQKNVRRPLWILLLLFLLISCRLIMALLSRPVAVPSDRS